MKQSRFYILFFFVVCIGLFCSCLSNDDDAQWSKFNGVYVTVGGDNIRGYKLYTDFGAILVPTEESLNRIPWLKEVQRAIVLTYWMKMKIQLNWRTEKLMMLY